LYDLEAGLDELAADELVADEATDDDSTEAVFPAESLFLAAEGAATELVAEEPFATEEAVTELAADDAATTDELAALVDAPFPDFPAALLAERIGVDDADTTAAVEDAVVTCESVAEEAIAAAVELEAAAPSVTVK